MKIFSILLAGSWALVCSVSEADNFGGSYTLEELDGTELKRRYAAMHVKKFYPQGEVLQQEVKLQEEGSEKDEDNDEELGSEEKED